MLECRHMKSAQIIFSWFKKPTTLTAIMLPATTLVAYMLTSSLEGRMSGDTTFAWLGLFIIFFTVPYAMVLFVVGLIKKRLILYVFCLIIPTFFYILLFLAATNPEDGGAPLSASVILIWLGAYSVCMWPSVRSINKMP